MNEPQFNQKSEISAFNLADLDVQELESRLELATISGSPDDLPETNGYCGVNSGDNGGGGGAGGGGGGGHPAPEEGKETIS